MVVMVFPAGLRSDYDTDKLAQRCNFPLVIGTQSRSAPDNADDLSWRMLNDHPNPIDRR